MSVMISLVAVELWQSWQFQTVTQTRIVMILLVVHHNLWMVSHLPSIKTNTSSGALKLENMLCMQHLYFLPVFIEGMLMVIFFTFEHDVRRDRICVQMEQNDF